MIKQTINSEFIKLDQLLKLAGVVQTGGQAKQIILDGEVSVNKIICKLRGKKLYNRDIIQYQDQLIEVVSDVK